MTWRSYLLLSILGLLVVSIVAVFQSTPGYMDADYYYAGGLQLAEGHGFTEPYLWNYLDNPDGLPHPSHAYWMPLASILAASGAAIFGTTSWTGARVGFLLVAGCIPPLTAALAWSLTYQKKVALTAGLLAVFPAFYVPFLPVTDTFGIYMLLGASFILLLARFTRPVGRSPFLVTACLLGVVAGLMHLTRTDGLLWLVVALAAVVLYRRSGEFRYVLPLSIAAVLVGYLLVMTPWFLRNVHAFGSPLGPGSLKMLWLTDYNQLFVYPAKNLTFTSWWQSGIGAILKARAWALGINVERTLAEQGEIFLLPLILSGLWFMRRDQRIWLGLGGWGMTFLAMTLVFPFAGARGGFFHSGAALQPLWWVLAVVGLDRLIEWGRRKRNWDALMAGTIFRPAVVGLAILLTGAIIWMRFAPTKGINNTEQVWGDEKWSQENIAYSRIGNYLVENEGVFESQVVMVANPPGFYLATGIHAVAVPDGDVKVLLNAASRYNASYLLLDSTGLPAGLVPVYKDPENQPNLIYKGQVGTVRIFYIHH